MTAPKKGYRTCTKCGRNRAERFFKPRGTVCSTCLKRRVSVASRDVRIFTTYGITLEEYDQILQAQGGGCAICGRTPKYNLDVDHDHALERELIAMGVAPSVARRQSIRGLLDKPCNRRLLPSVRDSKVTLINACVYLSDPPAFNVLSRADLT